MTDDARILIVIPIIQRPLGIGASDVPVVGAVVECVVGWVCLCRNRFLYSPVMNCTFRRSAQSVCWFASRVTTSRSSGVTTSAHACIWATS